MRLQYDRIDEFNAIILLWNAIERKNVYSNEYRNDELQNKKEQARQSTPINL